ncbi:MAG: DUF4388 domain-containing protein [Gammaproteobacteria bacterium]|nr:DUF4388 domain-containing protein [Gammaproteobacteria bacterium]MBU1655510.1 DUF4388 domain-containing protein [Gammaproteobacteria bacterium]MBU1961258.1 DUF4388 domain-containing protein [Gammaproteobacteria bacterium]
MTTTLNRSRLADLVAELARHGRSGSLLVRSDNGHALMVVFREGKLIALSYGNHRGTAALPDILAFSGGTYSFSEGVGQEQEGLPTAAEFAALLRGAAAPAQEGDSAGTFRSPDLFMERLAALLMESVGPIASLLCENQTLDLGEIKSKADAQHRIELLAEEILDNVEQRRFLSKAAEVLGRLG